MKIRDVMHTHTITIESSNTMGEAFRQMLRNEIRHLPVLHDGKVAGMLSEKDVLRVRAAADEGEWWNVPVEIGMSKPVHTASPDDSVTEVAARLAAHRIGALPVVERGVLIGIVSVVDILEADVRTAMQPGHRRETAADAMTPGLITVRSRTPAADAVRTMLKARIRHLPVMDSGNTLIGMVTERDAHDAAWNPTVVERGDAAAQPSVDDIMSARPVAVRFDMPLDVLARRLADERLDAVLVTDSSGAMIGIVSYVDVLRTFAA